MEVIGYLKVEILRFLSLINIGAYVKIEKIDFSVIELIAILIFIVISLYNVKYDFLFVVGTTSIIMASLFAIFISNFIRGLPISKG